MRPLLLLALLAGCSAQGPWDILKKPMDAFQGTKQRVVGRLIDEAGKADDSLTPDFLRILKSGNLNSLNFSTLDDANIPDKVYTTMGAGPLLTLKPDVMQEMLNKDKFKSDKLEMQIRNFLDANVTQEKAVQSLRSLLKPENAKGKRSKLENLKSRLGEPRDWNKENITAMKDIVFALPMEMLMKIRNTEAIEEIESEVSNCIAGSTRKSASCPTTSESKGSTYTAKSRRMMALRSWLIVKMNGRAKDWRNETFTEMEVANMPHELLTQIDPEVLVAKKSDIVQMLNGDTRKRRMVGRDVVESLLDAENVKEMTDKNDVNKFLASLGGNLGDLVYRSDINDKVLEDKTLRDNLKLNERGAIKTGRISGKATGDLMRQMAGTSSISEDQIRDYGMEILSLAPPEQLDAAVKMMQPSKNQLKILTDAIQATGGALAQGKLRQMSSMILKMARTSGGIDIAGIPDQVMDILPLKDYKSMGTNNAVDVMKREPELSEARTAALLKTVGTSSNVIQQLPPNGRVQVSAAAISKAAGTSPLVYKRIAEGLPAASAAGMLAAEKIFVTNTNRRKLDIKGNIAVVPLMGAAEARKVREEDIRETLEDMGDMQPSREACHTLKDVLVNQTKSELGARNSDEAFELLTDVDYETIPVCVITAFGIDKIPRMSRIMKIVLMDRLVRLGDSLFSGTGVEIRAAKRIMEEGFRALDKRDLTGVDVEDYGSSLLLAPVSALRTLPPDAAPDLLMIFNELSRKSMMPPLDKPRSDAIKKMMFDYYGSNLSKWSNLSPVCCLLFVLSAGEMSALEDGTLVSCVCKKEDKALYNSMMEGKVADAKMDVGDGGYRDDMFAKNNVMYVQEQAGLQLMDPSNAGGSRRKRAVQDISLCNKAAVSGADQITLQQLRNTEDDVIASCLPGLGRKWMDVDKAREIFDKVRKNQTEGRLSEIPAGVLSQMGFILRGVQPKDVPSLKEFKYDGFNDVVALLGRKDMKLPNDLLSAYAKRVLETWKDPVNGWTSDELMIAGRLLCGMNATNLATIDADQLKFAIGQLGDTLEGCSVTDVLTPIAKKAQEAYGPPSKWSKADVREMGVIASGIDKEYVSAIAPEAMAGLTTAAVQNLPIGTVKVLSAEQVSNLQQSSAMAFSGPQLGALTSDARTAAEAATLGGDAAGLVASLLLCVLGCLLTRIM